MANGFVEFDGHLAGPKLPLPHLDGAELSAVGTGLRFAEQFGLLESQILGDMPGDSFADLAGSEFDAGKGSRFPSHVWIVQIDAKFFS
jgi:hypothetical protein